MSNSIPGEYKFRFTVIIPVYNVEEYLAEAIDSIIGQSIGFRDNIQIVLVNDGSPDDSDRICRRYQEEYPDNIFYYEKPNGGVSSARNEGLKHVSGRYVNFMDSDDIWEKDAFRHVSEFFENNPETGIAACRLFFFGNKKKVRHHLDYVFDETRVIDILNDYRYPHLSVARSFFEAELLKDRLFNEEIKIAEDALFFNMLLLEVGKFGVVREAEYYYRKREDETSAMDKSKKDPGYYFDTPKVVYLALMDKSRELYGKVIPYIQYLLITDLQWRLKVPAPEWMSEAEAEEYRGMMRSILSEIDDEVIAEQHNMPLWYKCYVLRAKHRDRVYELSKPVLDKLACDVKFSANIVNADEDLYIAATAHEKWLGDEYSVYAVDNHKVRYPMEYVRYPAVDKTGLFPEICMQGYVHRIHLPLKEGVKYRFVITDGGELKKVIKPFYNKFSHLTTIDDSFFTNGKWITRAIKKEILVEAYDTLEAQAYSNAYNEALREKGADAAVELRLLAAKKKESLKPSLFHSNKIWIAGGFEGLTDEELARVIPAVGAAARKNRAKLYFVIKDGDSKYATMKKPGKPLEHGSEEHLVTQLVSSRVIAPEGEDQVFNPYGKDWKYLRDIIDYDLAYVTNHAIKYGSREPLRVIDKNEILGAVSWI